MIMDDANPGQPGTPAVVTHFQEMLMALRPKIPIELIEDDPSLADFYAFQLHPLETLPAWLDTNARRMLSEQGLPSQATPYLSFFDAGRASRISTSLPALGLAIGHDGGGNLLAIDAASGEVVMWDHDNDDARVFVNRDLPRFASCLCEVPRGIHNRQGFLQAVANIDPAAAAKEAFWPSQC